MSVVAHLVRKLAKFNLINLKNAKNLHHRKFAVHSGLIQLLKVTEHLVDSHLKDER